MDKLVNGHQVDIGDVRLFELGLEGLAINKIAVNKISIEFNWNDVVSKCIEAYNKAFRKLPFPLYSIETNLKYACLSHIMESDLKKAFKGEYSMWVDKSLCLYLKQDNLVVRFVGNTWCIEYIEEPYKDNTDFDLYKSDVGYTEYTWILEHLDDENLSVNFYNTFMPDFLRACGNNSNIMIKEFSKILDFEVVPEEVSLKSRTIFDTDTSSEYFIDIYCSKFKKTGNVCTTIDLTAEIDNQMTDTEEEIPVYALDVYKKRFMAVDGRSNALGGIQLNNRLTQIVSCLVDNIDCETEITGIKYGDLLFLELDNAIYKYDIARDAMSLVGEDIEIYSYRGAYIYFIRRQRIREKNYKNIVYKYNSGNGNINIARIFFS